MLYMQDMDPGPAKMLQKPEKGDTSRSRMKRPATEQGRKTQEISEEHHQNYLPSNTHLEGNLSFEILSQVYWVVLMGNDRVFHWFAQNASWG